jgi:hypothetical protein
MIAMTVHCVHLCSTHRASEKNQFLVPPQPEEKYDRTRHWNTIFYVKFNILLELKF